MLVQESANRDHETGRAEAALGRVVLDESPAHGVRLIPAQSLDRRDLLANRLQRQNGGGTLRLAVDQHRAGPS